MKLLRNFSCVCLVVGVGAGCDSKSGSDTAARKGHAFTVAVAFYPIEEVVRRVGGDAVNVINLTPPGGEPHDLELTAQKTRELEGANIVFYIGGGFQPGVESVIDGLPSSVIRVNLLDGLKLLPVTPQLVGTSGDVAGEVLTGNADPHVWVDPTNMIVMARVVETSLVSESPLDRATFEPNSNAYISELTTLDDEFKTQLKTCESRTIITSHRAFEYLARHVNLEQVPIAGISPGEEPDARSLEAIAAVAKAKGVTVVFFETQVPKDLSETIAGEIGATTDALDPVETITQEGLDAGATYITIQRANLAALVKALRCR